MLPKWQPFTAKEKLLFYSVTVICFIGVIFLFGFTNVPQLIVEHKIIPGVSTQFFILLLTGYFVAVFMVGQFAMILLAKPFFNKQEIELFVAKIHVRGRFGSMIPMRWKQKMIDWLWQ